MGSKSPQQCGFTNRLTVIVSVITLILFIGLCCTVVESKVSEHYGYFHLFRMCGLPSQVSFSRLSVFFLFLLRLTAKDKKKVFPI